MIASGSAGHTGSLSVRSCSAFHIHDPPAHPSFTHFTGEQKTHCSKPAWRMPVPSFWFPDNLMCFILLPHPLLLILSRLLLSWLVWLCSCYAFGLHCPVSEVTFPSPPSILSSGIVPSPAQRGWTGHSMAILMSVLVLWHLQGGLFQLHGIQQDCGCVTQYATIYAAFSSSGKKGQESTLVLR